MNRLAREKYQTLITSLPHLPKKIDDTYRPISRPLFEDRLSMLDESDRHLYQLISDTFKQERKMTKSYKLQETTSLQVIINMLGASGLRQIISYISDIKIICASLRRRKLGLQNENKNTTDLYRHIDHNWQHPTFKLGEQFQWIDSVKFLIEKENYSAAHKRIQKMVWRFLYMEADKYFFSREALFLYIIRWEMIRSWALRNKKTGLNRFHNITNELFNQAAL